MAENEKPDSTYFVEPNRDPQGSIYIHIRGQKGLRLITAEAVARLLEKEKSDDTSAE